MHVNISFIIINLLGCYKYLIDLQYKLLEVHLTFGHINIGNCTKLHISVQLGSLKKNLCFMWHMGSMISSYTL